MNEAFVTEAFAGWLRRLENSGASDWDMAALIPNPPGQALMTVADLRRVVEKLRGRTLRHDECEARALQALLVKE